jgi:hypothetical protein
MVTTYSTGTKKSRQVWENTIHTISTMQPTTKRRLVRRTSILLKLPWALVQLQRQFKAITNFINSSQHASKGNPIQPKITLLLVPLATNTTNNANSQSTSRGIILLREIMPRRLRSYHNTTTITDSQ